MPKLRVHNFTISLDGYAAGPDQSLDNPLGVGGENLHDWVVATRTFQRIHGEEGGEEGSVDDSFAACGLENIGAEIMGRNKFGPIRGPWGDDSWQGWWGENPPFHYPVFVLTHHPRPHLEMEGGTTFHFVTDGIEAALERAFEAADGQDVAVGGGASTIQQFLRAGLIDEMHPHPPRRRGAPFRQSQRRPRQLRMCRACWFAVCNPCPPRQNHDVTTPSSILENLHRGHNATRLL